MAIYTIELRKLIENNFDLGLNEYPIFDEKYRQILNQKIINHYYFREIGFETPARFRHYLKTKMAEIMPLYNQYYKSTLLEYNPFYTINKTEEFKQNANATTTTNGWSNGNATSNTTNNVNSNSNNSQNTAGQILHTNENFNVKSDTPGSKITENDLKNNFYASSAEKNQGNQKTEYKDYTINSNEDNSSESTSNSNAETNALSGSNAENNTTENYIRNVYGKAEGESYQELLLKFRDTFINIDMDILEELDELFMQIYN